MPILGRYGLILEVEGKEVPLLFTNEAIADAEARLGRSVMLVVQGFINGRSGVTEIGTLLRSGMEAGRKASKIAGRTPTLSDAYKIMDEVGMTKVAESIMPAITEVLRFGTEDDELAEEDEDPN
jgi:hypothetical protein